MTSEPSVQAPFAPDLAAASSPSAKQAPPILRVEALSVAYGDAIAVRDVSFDVRQGSIIALLGSNGAGKTTTVLTVAGARRPRSGKVIFKGDDVTGTDCKPLVERGLSLVPEGRLVFPQMTVDEHLRIGALNRRATVNLQRNRDRVFSLFPRLSERCGQLGASMSGGEQQMLAIARGLMAEPEVLILDEPSLGLSPKFVSELFGLIHRLRAGGITVILVEQNVKRSLQIADFAYVLEKGRVIKSGSGPELLDDPLVQKAYLGH